MKRQIKSAVAITTLAISASTSMTADACDRGRRSILSRSRFSVRAAPIRRQPAPVYAHTYYSQPTNVYRPPVQTVPPPQFTPAPAPQPTRTVIVNGRRVVVPQGQSIPATQNPAQPVGQPAGQPPRVASTQGPGVAGNTIAPQQRIAPQPASQAAGQARQVVQQQAPANTKTMAAQPATAPAQATAESSALQMLASIGNSAGTTEPSAASSPQIPEFGPASNGQPVEHVGTWSVNLPGNQSVRLDLNSDGSFSWTATKNGSSSVFKGQYRMEKDRLTLVRSNDLKQMAGSWMGGGEAFTFKLDGATTGGLAFKKS